jgi:iron complex outermembrane receptor protein
MKKSLQRIAVSFATFMVLLGPIVAAPTLLAGNGKWQDRIITGKITDADTGEPLPGATIIIKGTTQGTAANADGEFTLTVPEGAEKLLINYLGYQTLEISINNQTIFDVSLRVDYAALNEVVVVGYGTQKKADLTGAVGTLKEDGFNNGIIASPAELLQGKLAGVNVTGINGEPGADQTILIRGVSTLREGNQPLFVVDGVPLDNGSNTYANRGSVGFGNSPAPSPLNFINPADIESIDVLKDASAAAVYGSRAANGVIIITTKKGSIDKSSVNYSNYFGLSSIARRIDVLSTEQFIDFQERIGNTGESVILDRNNNTDWQDEFFRTAFTQNHNISFSGGSENSDFYASLSALDQEGIQETNSLKRYTARVNFTQRFLEDRASVGVNLTAGHTASLGIGKLDNAGANFGSLIPDILGANPTYPVRNPDGSLFIFPNGRNPFASIELFYPESRLDRVLGNINGSFELAEGLVYKVNFAMDRGISNAENLARPSGLPKIETPEGEIQFASAENTNQLIENFINYSKVLGEHELAFLAGHSYQRFFQRSNRWGIRDFTTDEIDPTFAPQIGSSIDINDAGGSGEINELQSFFGRANYSFADKYLLTATLRADGSSRFGKNNKYGVFPSISGAWRISDDAFMASSSVFSDLKLRAGWGATGNQEIPNKITQPSLTASVDERDRGYPVTVGPGNSGVDAGFIFNRTANPDLRWEVTTQTNIGLDFALFNGSISGTVDYFYKNTTDVLLNLTVPDPISPTSTRWENIDMDIINEGLEMSLNYSSPFSRKFVYELGANATILNNRVENAPFSLLATGDLDGPGLSGVTSAAILNGEPVGTFFLRQHLGFDESGQNIFRDVDGDGVITAGDRMISGSPIPDFTYNFYGTLRYSGFSFSFNFNGVSGNKIYSNTANAYFNNPQLSQGVNIAEAYFTPEEGETNSATESTRYLEDGDFLRLNNATLRYDFGLADFKWASKLGVFVTGQNLFVITDYSGFDPEVNVNQSVGGITSFGIDHINYPRARSFMIGMDVAF